MAKIDNIIFEIQSLAKKDPSFKKRLLEDPIEILKKFNLSIQNKNSIRIEDNLYGGVFLAFDQSSLPEATMIQIKTSSSSKCS